MSELSQSEIKSNVSKITILTRAVQQLGDKHPQERVRFFDCRECILWQLKDWKKTRPDEQFKINEEKLMVDWYEKLENPTRILRDGIAEIIRCVDAGTMPDPVPKLIPATPESESQKWTIHTLEKWQVGESKT